MSVPRGPPHVTLCHLAEAGGHPMCGEDAEWRPAPGSVGARLGPCFASLSRVALLGEFSQLPREVDAVLAFQMRT